MSTYTELASIINSTDSISDKVIYDASHNQFTIVSDETVLKIIRALKDTIVVALVSGFSKTSYLVQDHVKYIKRIQTAKSPVSYVKFVARKLFPDNAAYTAKIAKIHESYKNKQALLDKLEALFELYYNVTKDSSTGPPKRAVTMNEAEKTLAELLA
ncbi:16254_t:CDS:1 [Rhizophagus irregularis]|nr:16254_t:CDS:1 [Rhizophagus irregularis]